MSAIQSVFKELCAEFDLEYRDMSGEINPQCNIEKDGKLRGMVFFATENGDSEIEFGFMETLPGRSRSTELIKVQLVDPDFLDKSRTMLRFMAKGVEDGLVENELRWWNL